MGRILHLHLKSVPSTSRPAPLPLPLAPGRGTVRQAGRRTAPPSLPHPKRSPPPSYSTPLTQGCQRAP